MAYRIPTVSELAAQFKANVETQINQTVPSVARAFVSVVAIAWAMLVAGIYRYAAERVQQVLALTATGADLDALGAQYGVTRTVAIAAVLEAEVSASDPGAEIPATCSFLGQGNGIRYFPDSSYTPVGAVIPMTLTAEDVGASGNLDVGAFLDIAFQVSGAGTIATVTAVATTGADAETDADYRLRILSAMRSPGGGGNAADYRRWAEETPGVARAYPYAGKPYPLAGTPPDRTVYVEAETSVSPDRVPPTSLLDDVRDYITTDPTTGEARQPLGLTDDTLYIEAVTLRNFYVDVRGLSATETAQAQADITAALSAYFSAARPYVAGIDFESERNDTFTTVSVAGVVSDALRSTGGSAEAVSFGLAPSDVQAVYTLNPGELPVFGGVTFS